MTDEEKQYSERELINKWVISFNDTFIENFLKWKKLDHYQSNAMLCFFYVDHCQGNSMNLHALCRFEPENRPQILLFLSDISCNYIIRQETTDHLFPLPDELVKDLSLPIKPDWLGIYEPDELSRIRNRVDLDQFRAPGYFDDVQVALFSKNQEHRPEVVWVRLEEMSEDARLFRGTLLNEPNNDFGVHVGDIISVFYVSNKDACLLISGNGVI